MVKGVMVVEAEVSAKQEQQYNDWYLQTHIPQILAIPGFTVGRRYKRASQAETGESARSYITIFEIESDDLQTPMAELAARSADGRVERSEGTESKTLSVNVYTLVDK